MTTLREAAQQALEALERSETTVQYEGFGMARRDAERKHQAAITALRAALAEPVQEPVAWSHINGTSDTKWHPPQRQPLTEEEIWRTYKNLWMFHPAEEPRLAGDVLKFARAIERAHGIT